jgi:hypothetical protein
MLDVEFHAITDAMNARVAAALPEGAKLNVEYSAWPGGDGPVDNLDEVAFEGRCRFVTEHDPFWGPGRSYKSDVLDSPTWLQVAVLANAMISTTGDKHHCFLEDVSVVGRDRDVAMLSFAMGS